MRVPSVSQSVTQRLLTQWMLTPAPFSSTSLLFRRTRCKVVGEPSLKMTCVTRSLHDLVVFAPRRWSRATKGAEADAPSRVKTSTRAVTPLKGAAGCGVIGTCEGVIAGPFRGVFVVACEETGVLAFKATFRSVSALEIVAGRFAGVVLAGVRKRAGPAIVLACSA